MWERKPVTATIVTQHEQHDPSAAVSHGPRSGERQKVARKGPGGGVSGKSFGRFTAGAAGRTSVRSTVSRSSTARPARAAEGARPSTATRAQANHSLTTPGASSRHARAERRRAGRVDLDQRRAPRAERLGGAGQQGGRAAADPDVAVEQERRAPLAGARDLLEDGAEHGVGAAAAGEPYGDGGEVDPERLRAGGHQRRDVAPRPAADVQRRAVDPGQHGAVGVVERAEPAVQGQRLEAPVGQPQARLRGRARAERVLGGRGQQPAVERRRADPAQRRSGRG